jgi:hypothetical protein
MINKISETSLEFSHFSEELKRQVNDDGESVVLVFGEGGKNHMAIEHEDHHIGLEIDSFDESISLISEILEAGFIKIADTSKYKSDREIEVAIESGVYELPLTIKPMAH